ncbi:MAG TPA: methionyl-tRNA formyltransferase [Burkholderiales bacterium]|nr:methionyl-tRNA formyltransferase [Burkholderiales bacterium]
MIWRARSSSSISRSLSSSASAPSSRSSCASPPDAFLRLIFAGTPAFAERSLVRLLDAGHSITLVLTQPDRPAGRGLRASASPVKTLALERGLHVLQPQSLRDDTIMAQLRAARPDAIIVVAYGLLLPPPLLAIGGHGAINVHASLLPRWRGAAPIQRALLAGDTETGVSIMQMDEGLDTGPVFTQRRLAISADDDYGTLHDRLASLGAEALMETLTEIAAGRACSAPQSQAGVTYAPKTQKSETRLDWQRPAVELERAVRAFRPTPGALAHLAGHPVKVWRSRVVSGAGVPGSILRSDNALHVACGASALALDELQPAGGRRMSSAEFVRGRRIAPGTRFE